VQTEGGQTILIVEDEVLLRDLTRQILELHHYKVLVAGDGTEALGILSDSSIDLLLTDLNLPGISGHELRERAMALHPGIQVIFMSGEFTGEEAPTELVQTAYLAKPASATQLLAKIRQMITK